MNVLSHLRAPVRALLFLTTCVIIPVHASAQRVPFERTFPVQGAATLDVRTDRGKIEVVAGESGRIVVEGTVTVRTGWNVPVDAVEIAKQVAAAPPVEQSGAIVKLTVPADDKAQRAVTISYRVRVPRDTAVTSNSGSGETSIHGVGGAVSVRTGSSTIDVGDLGDTVQLATGSGAVSASDIAGALTVTTGSSAFEGTRLRSSLNVRTGSGTVRASFEGGGDVDVETASSAISLTGVGGALLARTQSGRVTVEGSPTRDWTVTTSSGAVSLDVASAGFVVDATSRSSDVDVSGASVAGSSVKGAIRGTVGAGGPTVRVRTRSGAVKIRVAGR